MELSEVFITLHTYDPQPLYSSPISKPYFTSLRFLLHIQFASPFYYCLLILIIIVELSEVFITLHTYDPHPLYSSPISKPYFTSLRFLLHIQFASPFYYCLLILIIIVELSEVFITLHTYDPHPLYSSPISKPYFTSLRFLLHIQFASPFYYCYNILLHGFYPCFSFAPFRYHSPYLSVSPFKLCLTLSFYC